MAKAQRRVDKKQNKLKHTLFKHESIKVSAEVSQHIVVGNGGLGNGISREVIESLFSPYGSILDIVMRRDKPYCFVSFTDTAAAQGAFSGLHGRLLKCPEEAPVAGLRFYLTFSQTLPGYDVPTSALPPGLRIVPDFVSEEEEEQLLLSSIDWDNVDQNMSQGSRQTLKHRRVKHYGYEFIYGINNVDRTLPLTQGIPDWCDFVIEKMKERRFVAHVPDQLTVNQYLPGQGIPPHIDTHSAFEDDIVSLSLGSQVVMDFRHADGRHCPVLLPRRSLLVMSGESRYSWTHGITPRKQDIIPVPQAQLPDSVPDEAACGDSNAAAAVGDVTGHAAGDQKMTLSFRQTRTSFTFRKILHEPCECKFSEHCDSQKEQLKEQRSVTEKPELPTTNDEAEKLESQHVHKVYEEIASHFSDTRHTPWPRVVAFLKRQPVGCVILDVGCGNGKYLAAVADSCFQIGCDRSANLCGICEGRGYPVFVSDCLALPVRDASVDVCLSIAVIHHLATHERRLAAVEELMRVLRPRGRALIYVWAMEQQLNKQKSNYLKDSKIKRASLVGDGELAGASSGVNAALEALSVSDDCAKCRDSMSVDTDPCGGKTFRQVLPEGSSAGIGGKELLSPGDREAQANEKRRLNVHVNRTQFQSQDLLVPWHLRDKEKKTMRTSESESKSVSGSEQNPVFHRYYHVFEQGELEKLCERINNIKVTESYYDKGNWCVVLDKM